jgi:hypothetical protein
MTRKRRPRTAASGSAPPAVRQGDEDRGPPLGEEAKRRPHSGQELRDGARSDPLSGDPRSGYSPPGRRGLDPRLWVDVIAFLGVLATGSVLLTVGHLTVGSLTVACGALVTLYTAWKHFRTPPTPPSGST